MRSPREGRGAELISVLEPMPDLLVLTHENPDPDCLASAQGLRVLIRHTLGRVVPVAFSGIIGRSQNRAMVSALGIRTVAAVRALADRSAAILLVDTQPGRRNNVLPSGVVPVAVIDHHPDWGANDGVPFVDLRESFGATSTIVTQYLQELEVPIDARLATALFYGISSETSHFGRETRPPDIVASQFLFPYVDKRLLGAIEAPRLKPSYFRLIADAVQSSVLVGDVLIAVLDAVPYPDAIAELADLFVRLEKANWAVCVAWHRGYLLCSLRSNEPEATAGLLLAELLPSGSAGGHGMVAAGRVAVERKRWERAAGELLRRLLHARVLDALSTESP
ncbi:MAG: DHH family phosphoesterase [Planctomycetota bacterium]